MLNESQLNRLKHQHEVLNELVKGLTDAQLRTQVNPGKWSAHESLAHLAIYQPVFIARLQRMQSENEPTFERYVADTDPAFLEGVQKPTAALISQLHADRLSIVSMLSSFSEEALQRKGIHPRYGKFAISQWVEFFLLHEAHHVFMIFMLTSDLKR